MYQQSQELQHEIVTLMTTVHDRIASAAAAAVCPVQLQFEAQFGLVQSLGPSFLGGGIGVAQATLIRDRARACEAASVGTTAERTAIENLLAAFGKFRLFTEAEQMQCVQHIASMRGSAIPEATARRRLNTCNLSQVRSL